MKRVSAALTGIVFILVALTAAHAASYSYTSFFYPGSRFTMPTGINNADTIVGYYEIDNIQHGFTLSGTTYTSLDYPGASWSSAYGINDGGIVVGDYGYYNDGHSLGYTLSGGAYISFDYPGSALIVGNGINNAGTVVGQYDDANGIGHGYTLSGGTYTSFDYPGAQLTSAGAINNAGTIVGQYGTGSAPDLLFHSYKLSGGIYSAINYPGASETNATGINDAGTIVGSYSGTDTVLHGFTLSGTTYTAIEYPGATETIAFGINNAGTVVGFYNDGSGAYRGFLASTGSAGDPDGIDWSMPDHLVAGKAFDAASHTSNGLLGHDSIYPPGGWVVNLFLTRNKQPVGSCNSDPFVEWRWEVTSAADVIAAPAPGCMSSMTVRELGSYTVTARKFTRATTTAEFTFPVNGIQRTQTVLARDFLIVGMGDSNGSGEGNPPWIYGKCDRSQTSYQFTSALYVEQRDPHSSVTFLFPACSGARIEHVYTLPYMGINPDSQLLDPQLDQVAQLLKLTGAPGEPKSPRNADAVILSAGVNNLFFGALIKYCAKQGQLGYTSCQDLPVRLDPITDPASLGGREFVSDPTSKTTVADIIAGLQNDNLDFPWYFRLQTELKKPVSEGGLGVAANHVIITQYPDFTHDWLGNTCNTAISRITDVARWGTSTWSWFNTQTNILNATVSTTAKYGWQVATLDQSLFSNHGYCAGDFKLKFYAWYPFFGNVTQFGQSYFLGIFYGLNNKNLQGAFHPLKAGHGITANAVEPLVCTALFGNATCEGPPTQ